MLLEAAEAASDGWWSGISGRSSKWKWKCGGGVDEVVDVEAEEYMVKSDGGSRGRLERWLVEEWVEAADAASDGWWSGTFGWSSKWRWK